MERRRDGDGYMIILALVVASRFRYEEVWFGAYILR